MGDGMVSVKASTKERSGASREAPRKALAGVDKMLFSARFFEKQLLVAKGIFCKFNFMFEDLF